MINLKKKEETAFSTISRHREINIKMGEAQSGIFFYQFWIVDRIICVKILEWSKILEDAN